MPKLPQISGHELAKVLKKENWIEKSQNIISNRKKSALTFNNENEKELFIKINKEKAKEIIFSRICFYCEKYNFKINKFKITNAKTQWGSCNGQNNISIHWSLVLADINILDYVVVHELAHTKEHNHSKKFWDIVENIIPDYKERRKWLKNNGINLKIE